MERVKSAYWVEFEHHKNQYFTLSEFNLIRVCLTEGRIITRLEKVELSIVKYKSVFGL